MSLRKTMGCTMSRKHFCPLCREQRRSYRDLLCDKCTFVREYAVLHGREGLRRALRGHPYTSADVNGTLRSAHLSTSSLASTVTGRGDVRRSNSYPGTGRYSGNPQFTIVKPVDPTAPPAPAYYPGQVLPTH